MFIHQWKIVLVVSVLLSPVRLAWGNEASDMAVQLAALKARVVELEAKQEETWLNQRQAQEVKSLVREVLADADLRTSLGGGALVAGHDGKHFFLSSDDGKFLMNITGQAQLRYIYNQRHGQGATDDHESGFQLRRTKLTFAGHVANPKLKYKLVLAANRNTNNIILEDLILGYEVMDGITLSGGRFKAPFLREELTSSGRQLAVDRSSVTELFTIGRTEGIQLTWESDHVKLAGSINDGAQNGEANVMGDFHTDTTDIAFTARADALLAGQWSQMKDFSAWDGEQMAVFLGGAVHYEIGESGDSQASTGFDDAFTWTVDGSLEMNRANVYGAVMSQSINPAAGERLTHWGYLVQGGYMVIPDKLEPFARVEYIDLEGADEVWVLTLGSNYYLNKHNAKFTADVVWGIEPLAGLGGTGVGASGTSSGLGLRSDGSGDNQVAIRAQFQMLF